MNRFEVIKSYYEANMGKGLPDYSVLGWESEEAQRLRFEILVDSVDLTGKSLLDVGCAMGSLLEYLKEKDIRCRYTGVDILQSMIDEAKRKKLDGEFFCADLFQNNIFEKKSFDVLYASGIFNLNLDNNLEFLHDAMQQFCELTRETVVFNLLHIGSPDKEDTYYYYRPEEVHHLAEGLGHRFGRIRIVENYLKNDFTVICNK